MVGSVQGTVDTVASQAAEDTRSFLVAADRIGIGEELGILGRKGFEDIVVGRVLDSRRSDLPVGSRNHLLELRILVVEHHMDLVAGLDFVDPCS